MRRPAVGNCGLHLRNRRGRLIAAPVRGLCKRSPQLPVAGRFVRLSPTGDGRGRGALGPDTAGSWKLRPLVERNHRGGSTQPPQGALQTKPATFSCRAFCAISTHGRWTRPRGVGARHGRQLETAAFVGRNRRGRFGAAPGRGLGKRSPQRPVAGRSVRFPPTNAECGRRALGLATAGSWKLRPSVGRNRGVVRRSPREGGLASEARNF